MHYLIAPPDVVAELLAPRPATAAPPRFRYDYGPGDTRDATGQPWDPASMDEGAG
jgi:hypothetical protein